MPQIETPTMIPEFVQRFDAARATLREQFLERHPDDYTAIVRAVVAVITSDGDDAIDPERVHKIDDGEYQGTLLFVIGAKGDQPSKYWYVKVEYGSCSTCDTLEAIKDYADEHVNPSEQQADEY